MTTHKRPLHLALGLAAILIGAPIRESSAQFGRGGGGGGGGGNRGGMMGGGFGGGMMGGGMMGGGMGQGMMPGFVPNPLGIGRQRGGMNGNQNMRGGNYDQGGYYNSGSTYDPYNRGYNGTNGGGGQPVYQQPTYPQQAPAAAPAPAPARTSPAPQPAPAAPKIEVKTVVLKPEPNALPRLIAATDSQRQSIRVLVERRMRALGDDLERLLEPALFRDEDVQTALALAKAHEASRDQLASLRRDLKDQKVEEVQAQFEELKVGENDAMPLVAKLEVSRLLEKLRDELDELQSTRAIRKTCKDLAESYRTLELPSAGLKRASDDLLGLAKLHDELRSDLGTSAGTAMGTLAQAPELLIVHIPPTAAGAPRMLALSSTTIAVEDPAVGPVGLSVQTGTGAGLGLPPIGAPASALVATEAKPMQGIVIRNPAATGQTISFYLDQTLYQLRPGSDQMAAELARAVISYNSGGSAGSPRYTLGPGTYQFVRGSRGLELQRQDYAITLDNSGNASDFHILLNGRQEKLPARQARTIRSSYPNIELSFDQGDGTRVVRTLLDAGSVWVGLDEQAKFSLFRGPRLTASTAPAQPPSTPATTADAVPPRDVVFPVGDVR